MWDYLKHVKKIKVQSIELRDLFEMVTEVAIKHEAMPIPVKQAPKPIPKGDDIDNILNDWAKGIPVPIVKLSASNYLFGTKKIYAKLNNGILLIKVGGGYMNLMGFYENYGPAELRKLEALK
jgi:hypothetical protein